MTPTPILRTALIYGAILAIVIAALGSLLGFLVAGTNGLVSALIGAAVTLLPLRGRSRVLSDAALGGPDEVKAILEAQVHEALDAIPPTKNGAPTP